MSKFKIGDDVVLNSHFDGEVFKVEKVMSVDTGSLKFETYTLSDGSVVGVSELRRWINRDTSGDANG